jgi:hypothetical protein
MSNPSAGTKLMLMCLCGLLASILITSQASAKEILPIKVYVDTDRIPFAVEPKVDNGTTLVQIRPLFEALGITLKWDKVGRVVTGQKTGLNFVLHIDSKDATVNGNKVKLTEAARIVNGNTVVPLRFIGEATGALVHWDNEYREIVIITEQWLASNGLTKGEAERMLNEPTIPKGPIANGDTTMLQGMYYNMSLDIANYCGGGFCFSYYTFFPNGKVFIGEPQNGGPERIDCLKILCNEYVVEDGHLILDHRSQFLIQHLEGGKLMIGDKEFIPVRPMNNNQKINGLYDTISTYGSTLGNAMSAGWIVFKEDGSYNNGSMLMGTDFNYLLEQGGYASDSSVSGTYEITGNTIVFNDDASERFSMFIMDISEDGSMQHLLIGGRMYKLN